MRTTAVTFLGLSALLQRKRNGDNEMLKRAKMSHKIISIVLRARDTGAAIDNADDSAEKVQFLKPKGERTWQVGDTWVWGMTLSPARKPKGHMFSKCVIHK